jgi:hypothetical protein
VNLLVVLVGDAPPSRLRAAVEGFAEFPARVHVVAPALTRPLDWLATAEEDAQRQAEVRALEIEWTLADTAEVEGGVGEADPVQAVEDALRDFAADEILVAGDAVDPDLVPALARFGLPVTRLPRELPPRRSAAYRGLRTLAAGRSGATPFVLFVGVNGALLLLGLLLSALVLLILWIAGYL